MWSSASVFKAHHRDWVLTRTVMQRILIQAAPCCQGNSKCLRKHGDRNAGYKTGKIQMGKRDICSDEYPLSEGHLRNAFVLSRCVKSSSTDRLTCKHTGSSAGSHTLTYMLHLAERQRGRGRGSWWERDGRRSCSALGEWEIQSTGSKGSWREIVKNVLWTGNIVFWFQFTVLFLFM